MSIYYVYIYSYPDGTPFYVGMGKKDRFLYHLKEANDLSKSSHKLNTIRKILREDSDPIISIIDKNISKEQASELEILLISEIGRVCNNTGPLTNIADGGTGGDTFSNNPNKDDIRNKISIKSKIYNNTPERKLLQSVIAKRNNHNRTKEDYIESGIKQSTTKSSQEWKDLHIVSESTRELHRQRQLNRYKDIEELVKLSKNMIERWQDPEYIANATVLRRVCCIVCKKETNLPNFYRWHKHEDII